MRQLQPGDLLDTFRIEKELHCSQVATLYKATDLVYLDSVVLKVPLDDIINNPVLLYHHQNEEKIGKQLKHPYLVRYLSRQKHRQYLVMEYIEGIDLRTYLSRQKQLSLERATAICRMIADGLSYLHERQILHLDIKPENIMICRDKTVKIIDFGVSRIVDSHDTLGVDFQGPKGSPYYIAPEQICGLRHYPESDIYSLGVVLYEMLTGDLPYSRSSSLEKVRERLKLEPVPPRYFVPDIPPAVQTIILRCLSRLPEQRYSSAKHLIDDLEHYQLLPAGSTGQLVSKPLPLLSYFESANCATLFPTTTSEGPQQQSRQLLGCISNHDSSDCVVHQLRSEALLNGGRITLLHILEDTVTTEFEKYIQEVEGAALSKRLDGYLAGLKKYGLQCDLRIKRGDPSGIILEIAKELKAEIIILGAPRPRMFFAKIFRGSVLDNIVKAGLTKVSIAADSESSGLSEIPDYNSLTPNDLAKIEMFLYTTWVEHMNWLAETCQKLLQDKPRPESTATISCSVDSWLEDLKQYPEFSEVCQAIDRCHGELHSAVEIMTKYCSLGNLAAMRNVYKYRALPLTEEAKTLFKDALEMFRSKQSMDLNSTP